MKTLCFTVLFSLSTLMAFSQNEDELPAISETNRIDFFIPVATCKKFNLEPGQVDEWMKVYNNSADNAALQRINDIRWQAKDKAEAIRWYNSNAALLGENGEDITSQMPKPLGVDGWNVYGASKETGKLMKALGIDQKQYDFTFTVDKYVAKIFISTTEKQTLKDAWQLAKEGLKATLRAAGKSKLADLVL